MGVGVALIPGGNNGLILAAILALSPGGTAACLLMTTTIVLGLSARARIFRKGPSNRCTSALGASRLWASATATAKSGPLRPHTTNIGGPCSRR